jgi:hypothetical protein
MSEPPRSAQVLVNLILKTPGFLDQAKTSPETLQTLADEVTKSLPPPAYVADRWTYRIVVISLGAVYLTARATGVAPPPDVLTALGAAAIGALAGLLAPSPVSK